MHKNNRFLLYTIGAFVAALHVFLIPFCVFHGAWSTHVTPSHSSTCVVINLPERHDRKTYMQAQVASNCMIWPAFHVYDAAAQTSLFTNQSWDPATHKYTRERRDGTLGVLFSNLLILEYFRFARQRHVFVLEDDVYIHALAFRAVDEFISTFPGPSFYDVVRFHCNEHLKRLIKLRDSVPVASFYSQVLQETVSLYRSEPNYWGYYSVLQNAHALHKIYDFLKSTPINDVDIMIGGGNPTITSLLYCTERTVLFEHGGFGSNIPKTEEQ